VRFQTIPTCPAPALGRLVLLVQKKRRLSTGGKRMHDSRRRAGELHELAARAHRTAAEHNEKGDHAAASWHAQRALEYSDHAYKLAQEAHNKSGQIVNI